MPGRTAVVWKVEYECIFIQPNRKSTADRAARHACPARLRLTVPVTEAGPDSGFRPAEGPPNGCPVFPGHRAGADVRPLREAAARNRRVGWLADVA